MIQEEEMATEARTPHRQAFLQHTDIVLKLSVKDIKHQTYNYTQKLSAFHQGSTFTEHRIQSSADFRIIN